MKRPRWGPRFSKNLLPLLPSKKPKFGSLYDLSRIVDEGPTLRLPGHKTDWPLPAKLGTPSKYRAVV